MKKIITMILAVMLILTVIVGTVSAAEPAMDKSWPEETIKIGVELWDTADETNIGAVNYFNYLADHYNVEFMFSESISSAEQEFEFADACAAAGCKGYIGIYNASFDSIAQHVTDHGMYYWCVERSIDEAFADNPYYLGGYNPVVSGSDIDGNGDYLLGYELAYTLAEGGAKHIVYCSGGAEIGLQMFVDRQEGFFDGLEAAKNDGYEVEFDLDKDIIPGWPGSDEFAARQSQAISGDYDAVACSFSGVEVWYQPILDAGRQDVMKIAGVGTVTDSIVSIAETGAIAALVYECEEVMLGNAVPMMINAVNGHSDLLKGEEGYCLVDTNRWTLKDIEDFKAVLEKHEAGEFYVSAEDMIQLFPEFNPELTKEEFINFYTRLTLDHAMGRE